MIVNNNFVIRKIFNTVILFPIKANRLSNDPIYINDVVYQILKYAPNVKDTKELCNVIVKLFSLEKKEEIDEVINCVEELVKMELIIEENTDEQ